MNESESSSGLVLELAEEFLDRYRNGERPPLKEYTDRYPELAAEINEVFPAMAMMERIAVADESLTVPVRKTPPPSLPGHPGLQQLGDYRIIREIGHGGMGVVYEAEQLSLGRHVALKVLPHKSLSSEKTKKRFEREARAAAKLHHTNIVPVFGSGEQEGTPYYVMQFIQGTGLDIVIKELARMRPATSSSPATTGAAGSSRAPRLDVSMIAQSLLTGAYRPGEAADPGLAATATNDSPVPLAAPSSISSTPSSNRSGTSSSVTLPGQNDSSSGSRLRKLTYWQSVARVGVQVADALVYAHKQGVVHRDVKPSNLLLDMDGTVWVTDFGLAKTDDPENLTHTGDVLGTFRYMPPEAFEGKGDSRGDIYSLGLTLYELVALRPAFDEADRNKLLKQVTTMEPKPLSRVRSGVPRDLETIIHKSIEREPARRYQKAEDLTEDLRRFLEDRPVRARRASNLERVARWARRNPAVASLLGVVTMLMIGVSIASSLAAVQFRHARDDADAARVRAEKSGDSERWERYRANMIAAGGAMQLNNVSAAQAALDAAPEEHRNWEWKYFNHRLDTAQQVIHLGENLRALAVSHDGKFAAFQPADGPARLWDIESRKEIGPLGNTTPAQSFCFSSRNTMLAWMSGDRVVLWDIPAGRVRSVVVLPAKSHVEPALSPDGTRLLVGLQDRTARVWDTATGKQLHLLPGHEAPGPAAFFSSDGRRIASAGEQDRIVRIWDAETGELLEKLDDNNAPAGLVYFNRSDDRILSIEGYPSNALRLWDAAARKCLKVMRGHTNGAEFAAFSPDGSRIASGGLDRTVRLWDGRTGEALTSREGHRGALTAMTFSPDGSCVLSAAQDQTARLWDAKTGDPVSVLHGHTGAITSAYYTPDGTKIVTASVGDGTVRIWDAQSAQTHGSLRGHQSFVYDVAFHPDGERVASAAWDGTVRVWDATSGRQFPPIVYPYPPATEHKIVSSLAFHPAGKLVAAFGRDAALRFWDLATSQEVFSLSLPAGTYTNDGRMAFNATGTLVAASAGSKFSVHVWDVDRRAESAVLRGHTDLVIDVGFSPDSSWLASASWDHTIRIWNLQTKEPIQVLEGHTDKVIALAISRDGRLLASGSVDGTVRIWDTKTWKEVAAPLKHGSIVYGVSFSPDGTRLACACANNMVRLWDTASFQLVAELDGHAAYVHQVAFSPDGTRLVSGSGDFTVRVWDSLSVRERAQRVAAR